MAPYVPKKGDFVTFKFLEDPAKTKETEQKYGKFEKIASGKLSYYDPADTKKLVEIAAAKWETDSVKKSAWARMRFNAAPNFREAAENSALFIAYSSVLQKNQFMGPENLSFLVASGVHEFVLKGFASGIADMLGPTSITTDADAMFRMEDFSEPIRRAPFIWAIQQATQKFLFKKQFSHQAVSNLLGGYASMALTNIGDRMYYADSGKYTYP